MKACQVRRPNIMSPGLAMAVAISRPITSSLYRWPPAAAGVFVRAAEALHDASMRQLRESHSLRRHWPSPGSS